MNIRHLIGMAVLVACLGLPVQVPASSCGGSGGSSGGGGGGSGAGGKDAAAAAAQAGKDVDAAREAMAAATGGAGAPGVGRSVEVGVPGMAVEGVQGQAPSSAGAPSAVDKTRMDGVSVNPEAPEPAALR